MAGKNLDTERLAEDLQSLREMNAVQREADEKLYRELMDVSSWWRGRSAEAMEAWAARAYAAVTAVRDETELDIEQTQAYLNRVVEKDRQYAARMAWCNPGTAGFLSEQNGAGTGKGQKRTYRYADLIAGSAAFSAEYTEALNRKYEYVAFTDEADFAAFKSGFAAVPELWDTEEKFNGIREYVHWAGLVYKEDYQEKSRYVSTANGYAEKGRFNLLSGAYTDTGYDNIRYEIINGNRTAYERQQVNDVKFYTNETQYAGLESGLVSRYNYLTRTEGKEAANRYLEAMTVEQFTGIQAAMLGFVGVSVDVTAAGVKLVGGDITELQKLRTAGDLSQVQHPKAYGAGQAVFLSVESYGAGALVSGLGKVTGVGAKVMESVGKAGVYTLDGAATLGSVATVNTGAEYVLGDVTAGEYLKTVCTATVTGAAAGLTAYGVEKLIGKVAEVAKNVRQAKTTAPKSVETAGKIPTQQTTDELSAKNTANGFKYEHNPSDNPKVLQDAVEDPNAVYGYRPKEGGSLDAFTNGDWDDPIAVEEYRNQRIEYHNNNEGVTQKIVSEMKVKGANQEEIARAVNNYRNQSRINSYIDSNGQIRDINGYNAAIERAAKNSYENLIRNGKTPADIIQSATKGNPGMDACTGLYDVYFNTY